MTLDEVRKAVLEFKKAQEEEQEGVELLRWLLALLWAQRFNYHFLHWTVSGTGYYGNHLLFQRLYESVVGDIDTLGEKMVGIFGENAVDPTNITAKFVTWLERWNDVGGNDARGLLRRGLQSEEDMQQCCEDAYNVLKMTGEITLGMDDFLMAMANAHETNSYLLQQALRNE